jgi:hypothetical protein
VQHSQLNASAIVIALVCIVTAYSGVKLCVFLHGVGETVAALDTPSESEAQLATTAAMAFVARWKDVAGAADSARRLGLGVVKAEMPNDKAALETLLSNVVENSPTSDTIWQDIAEIRQARGRSVDAVLTAFRMSVLTGSHEGAGMIRRAIFGLEHWKDMPEPDRRTVVRDLLATISSDVKPQERYRQILAAKPELERDAVRAAILESGIATRGALEALEQ